MRPLRSRIRTLKDDVSPLVGFDFEVGMFLSGGVLKKTLLVSVVCSRGVGGVTTLTSHPQVALQVV